MENSLPFIVQFKQKVKREQLKETGCVALFGET